MRVAALWGLAAFLAAGTAAAEDRGEAHGSLRIFAQPASGDWLFIATPSVNGTVNVKPWLSFDVNWLADVVTGATPRTYGRPDVVTSATRFSEVRNVIGAGATTRLGPSTLSAGYAFGTENDYRSHLLRAGAKLDLFQHNTVVAADFSHSWNRVCDLAQSTVPITLRQPLDSSRGCFSNTPTLTEESLDTDALELSVVQTLSPRLLGALVGTYQHLSGFQSSPYRRVRLFGGAEQPQESHPTVRDRGAVTARLKLAIERFRASLGFDLRLYKDTWGVQSLTGEATWTQPFRRDSPDWSFAVRTRGYVQSGAVFYRDAGEANSYEIAGPVGRYFTADQEMAPIADLLVGARVVYATTRAPDHRIGHMFTEGDMAFLVDYLKIFALTPLPPNQPRTAGFASALVFGYTLSGRF